ncbi:MAG: GNAT family acetyltransferase [Lachnospiraceae bacterium]|nr:GNAT family acetyltransferase [Lachnospiraceae bacterium]
MRQFVTINILDMLGAIGETNLKKCLSDFSCPINLEIEQFVKENALDFAKKKLSVTYFVVNELGKIIAVFTLAHKAVEIGNANLSNSKRKKISRYAILDSEAGSYTVSAFLIAQFGKNYAVDEGKGISGNELMDLTFEVLDRVQHDIGGGIVFLECEDKIKLLDFYQSEKNGFIPFNERYSVNDNIKYVQLFNFF